MKVIVTIYSYRYGEDIGVYATFEGAENARQDIADEWWEHEMPKSESKPVDRKKMADAYFEHMENHDEFFSVEECEVIGL